MKPRYPKISIAVSQVKLCARRNPDVRLHLDGKRPVEMQQVGAVGTSRLFACPLCGHKKTTERDKTPICPGHGVLFVKQPSPTKIKTQHEAVRRCLNWADATERKQ